MMKGLDISKRFFSEWGLPWIRSEWPRLVGRVAAGRTGGSDVIGADDQFSRDHDWGPHFRVWLTHTDFRRFGTRFTKEINEAAPAKFDGVKFSFFGEPKDNVLVDSIDHFFLDEVGHRAPPKQEHGWFHCNKGTSLVENESWLYFIRHGHVFHDPLGRFSTRRDSFSRYPPDVRLKLIERQCTTLWYVTDYKFRWRLVHRNDGFAFHSAVEQTVEAAMKLCFYLNEDYAPHWQWLHHEFRKLPESETLGPVLDQFIRGRTAKECSVYIEPMLDILTQRLADEGLIERKCNDMMRAKDEVRLRIVNTRIRECY